MSWFSKNYEKTALGGAVIITLGIAFLGWSKNSGVDQDFDIGLKGGGNNNPAVAGAELIPKALQSLKLDRTWKQAMGGDRPVDLFTGIPLFIKSSDPQKAIDLFKDAPVHPPIPNTWWLENGISPDFADSPDRDPDADGFSNKEEYAAKTDPNDSKSRPALIAKLMYVKDESLAWGIRPGYGSGGAFPFSYTDSQGRTNKIPSGGMIKANEMFYAEEPMANRFKLLSSEVRKERNERINVEMEVTWVRIEDQRPNKKGTVYELPAPLSRDRLKAFLQFDRTAVLSLEAIGLEGQEFKVEENTAFALPPGSPNKDYRVIKVTPDSITVEFPDAQGTRKTVEIPKGTVPGIQE